MFTNRIDDSELVETFYTKLNTTLPVVTTFAIPGINLLKKALYTMAKITLS
jgi:hypothetical protein